MNDIKELEIRVKDLELLVQELKAQIADLQMLLYAYRHGYLKENKGNILL